MERSLNSWIAQPRGTPKNYVRGNSGLIRLDDTYEKIENIKGLKTSLFPHQKTVIKAMVDIENNRKFIFTGNEEVRTTAAVLSEAVGSGKTVDVLCLVMKQKTPKVYPDISHICVRPAHHYGSYSSVIRKKFRNILKPTLIFAGVSVINQWVSAVKTFTNLTCFCVSDVRDLQKLIIMMANKSINQYDLVIVKNGKVTRPVKFPPYIRIEGKNVNGTTSYIYNNIANMRNFCWARVVVDDFDTIKLPHNAGIVNALFTWYISSTKKYMNTKRIHNKEFTKTSDMLMYSNYNCGNIMKNSLLFESFNIRNKPSFVRATNNICSPKFYVYTFINPNDQYIGLLGLMGGDAIEVMEMLNGDAIETAAERIGIKTNSVADIFQIMLGNEFNKFKKSTDVLDYIKVVEPLQGQRTPMTQNPDPTDTYKKSDLFVRREILYNYPNLKGLLDQTKEEYTVIKQKSGVAIDRVKSNIKEGECPICTTELNDADEETIIIKCCGVVVCGMCCFGTLFKGKDTGQCSNCRSRLSLQSLIYLKSNFELDKILDDSLDAVCDSDDSDDDGDDNADEEKAPRTKYDAIMDIIKGVKPDEQQRIDLNIHNLMKGSAVLPEPSFNKVLVFANYDETIQKMKDILTKNNIPFDKLGGTHREISRTVEKFTKCQKTCVLIINSMKHCSGLNLQTCTDLIFAHRILDKNVETQVIGRGQRLGRINQLKVHYMLYENEYANMSRNHMRVIDSDDENITNVGASMIDGLSAQRMS